MEQFPEKLLYTESDNINEHQSIILQINDSLNDQKKANKDSASSDNDGWHKDKRYCGCEKRIFCVVAAIIFVTIFVLLGVFIMILRATNTLGVRSNDYFYYDDYVYYGYYDSTYGKTSYSTKGY